ncbi:MAG: type II secretion system GspH family protein [Phycisphaerales bacterium]|nr:type II secretion system GspH family protein [Phycisphaerales bacterium]
MTLIEVLVVIAIVGLPIAILAPGIGAVRARARNAMDASNLRQHAAVMAQDVGDWRDEYPLFLDPSRPRSTLRWKSRDRCLKTRCSFCLIWRGLWRCQTVTMMERWPRTPSGRPTSRSHVPNRAHGPCPSRVTTTRAHSWPGRTTGIPPRAVQIRPSRQGPREVQRCDSPRARPYS